ncbi:AIPR family protein [Bombella favorum]|uniref:Abortive phage infection protein C-terminal domain-containing protein n=1 Tax=Bombella favorum TaxID=2039164 RepID=A0ABR5ZMR5_9PROT|nr:AIPR family protein [Bombella favorum]MBA5725601.1 hypothetical protein [Bombella favorum]
MGLAANLSLRRFVKKLEQDIVPYLEGNFSSEEKRNSLALTGLFLASAAGMPLEYANKYIVDGSEDFGIDGIFYNEVTKVFYFVQTKFRTAQDKSIGQGDVLKFKNGIEKIIRANVSGAGKRLKNIYNEISGSLEDINTRIKMCIVTTSKVDIEPNCKDILDEFCSRQNDTDESFSWEYVNFNRLYQSARFFTKTDSNSIDINLYGMGILRDPHRAYYGHVAGEDVATWVCQHGTRLFEQNVRFTLCNSDVNEGILKTIREDPENFWYLNNGITAIASHVKYPPSETNPKKIHAEGINIINGAQTAGMLARALEEGIDLSQVRVSFRVISLEGTAPGFDEDVTRANNTQNELNALDFVSLDPRQDLIKTDLASKGYDYVVKRGSKTSEGLEQIEVKDAAVALACASGDIGISVQAKRYVSGLWSNLKGEPYTRIFPEDISGDEIIGKWKVYKLCLGVLKEIKSNAARDDLSILSHGDKFICHCVFRIIHEKGINFSNDTEVCRIVREVSFELIRIYNEEGDFGFPATTFKNTRSQLEIREILLGALLE